MRRCPRCGMAYIPESDSCISCGRRRGIFSRVRKNKPAPEISAARKSACFSFLLILCAAVFRYFAPRIDPIGKLSEASYNLIFMLIPCFLSALPPLSLFRRTRRSDRSTPEKTLAFTMIFLLVQVFACILVFFLAVFHFEYDNYFYFTAYDGFLLYISRFIFFIPGAWVISSLEGIHLTHGMLCIAANLCFWAVSILTLRAAWKLKKAQTSSAGEE